MSQEDIHVTPHHDGGWQVKREGADRASSLHDTQQEAIEEGRRIAQEERGELLVHDRHSQIRDRDSFGADPFPPRDRKH